MQRDADQADPTAAIRETSAPTADTRSPAVGRAATSAAARRATVLSG